MLTPERVVNVKNVPSMKGVLEVADGAEDAGLPATRLDRRQASRRDGFLALDPCDVDAEVVLEVVTSDPGRRNTIAVSEITVGTPAG